MIGFICGLILSQIMASCSEIKIASANPVDHPFSRTLQYGFKSSFPKIKNK